MFLLSRISVLVLLCTMVLTVAPAYSQDTVEVNQAGEFMGIRVVDMTHSIQNGIPIFFDIFDGLETVATVEASGYYMNLLRMTEHTSTHMDAPAHFVEGRWTVDQIPLEHLYGVAAVMDARPYITGPNDTITVDELMEWEERTGIEIPEGGILFVYTGWSDYWGTYNSWDEYMDVTGGGFPGFGVDAADYLISKGVIGVGIDTLSIDPAPSTTFDFHVKLLGTNAWAIENLYVPEELLDRVVFVVVAPMKIKAGSGAPTRVWAFYDPSATDVRVQYLLANLFKFAFDQSIKYDLTWPIENGIPIFFNIFGGFSNLATIEELGYYINWLEMTEHTSTHIDAPGHFVSGVWTIDEIPLDRLMGRAVIMDMRWAVTDPNDTVSVEEIMEWQYRTGISISRGDILIVYTGWGDHWGLYSEWARYMDVTGGGFPGYDIDAADYLIGRGVSATGIDTLSIDPAPSMTFDFHVSVLGENIYGVENVGITSNSPLLNKTAFVIMMPLLVRDGSGGPVRIYAFENLDLSSIINLYRVLKSVYEDEAALRQSIEAQSQLISGLESALESLGDRVDALSASLDSLSSDLQGLRDSMNNELKGIRDAIQEMDEAVKSSLSGLESGLSGVSTYSYLATGLALVSLLIAIYVVVSGRRP